MKLFFFREKIKIMKNSVKKEIEKLIKDYDLDCSIEEFKDKANWNRISYELKLSEDFIREFQNKVDWEDISYSQKLSKDFVLEFQDRVNWHNIEEYQNITKKDIEEYEEEKELEKTRVKNRFQLIRF